MRVFYYRRLRHDLYWGYRLFLMQEKHRASGVQGKNKGKGFRAYLGENKIPARLAYRLIERYGRFAAIWNEIHFANADCESDGELPE